MYLAASARPTALILSMFISYVRGDAIAVERNIPASCTSRKSNLSFHVPMVNINISGIRKTCLAIAGPLSVSKMVECIALCSSLKQHLLIKLKHK